jgi:hypothetical protein
MESLIGASCLVGCIGRMASAICAPASADWQLADRVETNPHQTTNGHFLIACIFNTAGMLVSALPISFACFLRDALQCHELLSRLYMCEINFP